MSPATFRLVMLVSCAHALVHVFELSLPSVEQMIGDEYGVDTERTGPLGTVWRLPFGVGALFAGWLADRYGSKPLLVVYLLGCAATAVAAWGAPSLDVLFLAMFAMGCFASIYHPAGLALISRETTPANRGAALGWHGIIGSCGIAGAPFLAGMVFQSGDVTWRQYYLLLVVPAVVLAVLLIVRLKEHHLRPAAPSAPVPELPRPAPADLSPGAAQVDRAHAAPDRQRQAGTGPAPPGDETARWGAFLLLVTVGALSGFIYAAFMHFLPRYLDGTGFRPTGMAPESYRNLLAAVVLLCGVVGQAWAGRIARPGRLEIQLGLVLFANVPLLLWMAVAEGPWRFWATCALAMVHFMNQPIYNSLVADCVPRARRSVGYGFSNMLCFGVGALGPTYAGFAQTNLWTYGGLAAVALLAGLTALTLRRTA